MGILDNIKNIFSGPNASSPFDELIEETRSEYARTNTYYYNVKVGKLEAYKKTLNLTDKEKIALILYCLQSIRTFNRNHSDEKKYHQVLIKEAYVNKLMQSKFDMDDEDLEAFKEELSKVQIQQYSTFEIFPFNALLTQLEKRSGNSALSESALNLLDLMKKKVNGFRDTVHEKQKLKCIDRIEKLIFEQKNTGSVKPRLFLGDDAFARYANPTIEAFPEEERKILYHLMEKAQSVKGSKPSMKFLNEAKEIVGHLGKEKFNSLMMDWFSFLSDLKETIQEGSYTFGGVIYKFVNGELICSVNAEALKGFVWISAAQADKTMLHALSQVAERSFKKIPGKGAGAPALGNACLYVLANAQGLEGIGLLSALKLRVKQPSSQAIIIKYLDEAARQHNVSAQEIEEMAADDFGIKDGFREFTVEGYTARLKITGVGKSELEWIKADGSIQKSIPAVLKEQQAEALKSIKNTQKQIDQAMSAQRDRIDRLFRSNRVLSADKFRKYYVEHGLLSWFSKKIIWTFRTGNLLQPVFWHNDAWRSIDGTPIMLSEQMEVVLWHPALYPQEQVRDWRNFLMKHEISQPLKQAYREIYLLTEAEINTRTYSNRMAAHILKQHQYVSLAKGRNWNAQLQGDWDGGDGVAILSLPEYNLRAEYWVDGLRGDNAQSESGIFKYVSTDQVRFVNNEGQAVELVDVPPVVFSEVMRDVDLFVGVASVGNDPEWQDSGDMQGHRDYWQSYSFGELSEVAKNRKEILTGLIPRLKIAKVTELKDKYVVVKGKLRTYKIHIGSTNILMEPNDQYLCIVPDRSKKNPASNLFIPFEGDNGLSIILSKAFLLADDDKITDKTITSQIERK